MHEMQNILVGAIVEPAQLRQENAESAGIDTVCLVNNCVDLDTYL
jgi:hypothetical protein